MSGLSEFLGKLEAREQRDLVEHMHEAEPETVEAFAELLEEHGGDVGAVLVAGPEAREIAVRAGELWIEADQAALQEVAGQDLPPKLTKPEAHASSSLASAPVQAKLEEPATAPLAAPAELAARQDAAIRERIERRLRQSEAAPEEADNGPAESPAPLAPPQQAAPPPWASLRRTGWRT